MNPTLKNSLLAIALVGAGTGLGVWLSRSTPSPTAAHPATSTAPAAERKPLYWHDPMFPQQKFDKPGKSPFMDMMLVPVFADDATEGGGITIDPAVVQSLGVRTGVVTKGPVERSLKLVGTVAFDERAVTVVQARVGGYVERLFVRAPLDPVTKGQPLAEILAPDWVAAQEEYLALKKSPQASEALREAARQRLLLLGMSDATVAAIEADGRSRPRVTLVSPVSGVVGELSVREGTTVMPGLPLFRLNGLSTVWIQAEVPEAQSAWLTPGSAVNVSVPAYPGTVFKGRVNALLPEVNAATRTQKARIEIANPQGKLAPGMFATLEATAGKGAADALRVPSEAVIQTGTRAVVIVAGSGADGRPRFTPTAVETGTEAAGFTEIRDGLAEGMKVVLSGQFLIDSEASLKAATHRLSSPAEDTHDGMKK